MFYALSRSATLKRLASEWHASGRIRAPLHRRRTVEGPPRAARTINRGVRSTIWVRSVRTLEGPTPRRAVRAAARRDRASGIERNVSLKLTAPRGVDRATCVDNHGALPNPPAHGFFVPSTWRTRWTQLTIEIFEPCGSGTP